MTFRNHRMKRAGPPSYEFTGLLPPIAPRAKAVVPESAARRRFYSPAPLAAAFLILASQFPDPAKLRACLGKPAERRAGKAEDSSDAE